MEGIWNIDYYSTKTRTTVTFNSDGTFTQPAGVYNGIWTLNGNQLTMTFTSIVVGGSFPEPLISTVSFNCLFDGVCNNPAYLVPLKWHAYKQDCSQYYLSNSTEQTNEPVKQTRSGKRY